MMASLMTVGRGANDERRTSSRDAIPAPAAVFAWNTRNRCALRGGHGAVAVVFTLGLLALQISANNKLLERQAYFNCLEPDHHPIAMSIQDAAFNTLL